jgi:hypothetical protein
MDTSDLLPTLGEYQNHVTECMAFILQTKPVIMRLVFSTSQNLSQ